MLKIAGIFISFIFCLSIAGNLTFAQTTVSEEEAQKWREDLRFMTQEMPKKHANLFHAVTREEFEAAVRKLDEGIPGLARHRIIVEMARIVAMVGRELDGHTSLPLLPPPHSTEGDFKVGFRRYPIRLHFFSDGIFVESTTSEYAKINGARLVKIGSTSVEDAFKAVSQIVSRDNRITLKDRVPPLLAVPEVLHALGLIESMEKAPYTFEIEGKQLVVEVSPSTAEDTKWIEARQSTTNPPLWLKDPNNLYWFEYLSDSKTVYFQYNGVVNKHGGESLSSFFRKLFAFIEANPVERLIIDMRMNGGGNGVLSWGLIYGIIRADKINKRGKLFTIIGQHTYSAGSATAAMLGTHTNTIFVGESPGGGVNVFGDHASIVLPNSGIELSVAPFFFQNTYPWDKRAWITPQITAALSSADYRRNNDPAMNAVLNYQPISDVLTKALAEGGLELLVKRYAEFRSDPKTSSINTEDDVNRFAYGLLRDKRFDEAVEVFKLNVKSYPGSSNAYDSLGDAYIQSGNKELAVKNYEKALELNPSSTYLVEKLRAIKNK